MKRGRLAMVALTASAVVFALVASGLLDVRIQFGTPDAEAIDLFGDEEKEPATPAEPFWQESTGGEEVAPPPGSPASLIP